MSTSNHRCRSLLRAFTLLTILAVSLSTQPIANAASSGPFKFDFGSGTTASGYTAVTESTSYSASRGYGFTDITKVSSRDRGAPDALRQDFVMPNGTDFKVDLTNGDYNVRIISGDQIAKSSVEVKAEGISKLTGLGGPAGTFGDATFKIAVVDGQLNLEFVGAVPRVNAVEITPVSGSGAGVKPTVYIAGDSTVMTYNSGYAPQQGWGGRLPDYFDKQKVAFVNKAIGGRSSKTFVTEGRLDEILSLIKPNDFFFIQFGHNDQVNDARHTDPSTTYKEYLRLYIDGAKQRGAIPVLVTPMSRRNPDSNGKFRNSFGAYATAMKELAVEKKIQLVDLNLKSIAYYDSIGAEASKKVFLYVDPGIYPHFPNGAQDATHFQEYGANQLARIVKESIKELAIQPLSSSIIK